MKVNVTQKELIRRIEELERRVATLEGRGTGELADCVDDGPCKSNGKCNGCVYAHQLGDKPCSAHTYSGCSD